jgi:hypothetical protein
MKSGERGGAPAPGSRQAAMVENEDASGWVRGMACGHGKWQRWRATAAFIPLGERNIGGGVGSDARSKKERGPTVRCVAKLQSEGGPVATARKWWSQVITGRRTTVEGESD